MLIAFDPWRLRLSARQWSILSVMYIVIQDYLDTQYLAPQSFFVAPVHFWGQDTSYPGPVTCQRMKLLQARYALSLIIRKKPRRILYLIHHKVMIWGSKSENINQDFRWYHQALEV
jgi:hypothetical protein